MKTTSKEFKAIVRAYIAECVSVDGYEGNFPDFGSKLALVVNAAKQAAFFPDNIKRFGYQGAFIDWLWGLPSCFNVDYENYRILEILESWGLPLPKGKDETDAINFFMNLIYREFSALCRINKINFPL